MLNVQHECNALEWSYIDRSVDPLFLERSVTYHRDH